MSKTLADIRTGVRIYLDESSPQDFLEPQLTKFINYAYQDVASEIMEVFEQYYMTTTAISADMVADTQEYTLDSSIIKTLRVELNYDTATSTSKPLRAKAIRLDELPRYLGDTNVGGSALLNCAYYVIGNQSAQKIGLIPVPKISSTAGIKIWGIQAPSDLSSESDAVLIPYPDRFAYLIELKAAADLLRKGQQEEGPAKQYMSEYLLGISRMKTFIRERQTDGPVMIQDALMEDVAFDFPL